MATTANSAAAEASADDAGIVDRLTTRARAALAAIAAAGQARIDEIVTAVAWSLYKPENARRLAELAVADTGIGNVEDKLAVHQRETFGALHDLRRARSVGVIDGDHGNGIIKYGKPVGVVGAMTPSTSPCATPVNLAMMALKGANAIVIAPAPSGWRGSNAAVELMRAALARVGAPEDLVQILPQPVSRGLTRALMRAVDLVVAGGSQDDLRAAYASGTPAIGAGAGNVPVIVDVNADFADAAQKIRASKAFDYGSRCAAENSLVILDQRYDEAMAALVAAGAWRCSAAEREKIRARLWIDGELNPALIGQNAGRLARGVGLDPGAAEADFFLVEETFDPASPFAGQKQSLVLSVYRARDFDHAVGLVRDILNLRGRGHSCGIHTRNFDHPVRLAEEIDVAHVLVNQAHSLGNGGSFGNGLNFSQATGCGTWGGNSISGNIDYRHFINVTRLVTSVAEDRPDEESLFGAYHARYGRD